jgi:hypothetical protein
MTKSAASPACIALHWERKQLGDHQLFAPVLFGAEATMLGLSELFVWTSSLRLPTTIVSRYSNRRHIVILTLGSFDPDLTDQDLEKVGVLLRHRRKMAVTFRIS